MNQSIKKITMLTIICTAFSTWTPSTSFIGSQYAYAYSDDEISSLGLTSGVSIIPIYSSVSHKSDTRVKAGDKIPVVIYSKLSSDQTSINLDTLTTKAADIRVFVGKEKIKLSDIHSAINISEGENKAIYIRLYDSKSAADDKFTTEYDLNVEREISDSDDNESEDDAVTLKDYDDIYLTKIYLYNSNTQPINLAFDKTQPIYNINVDKNCSYIRIKAVPEQRNYRVTINDKEADTKGNSKESLDVYLNEGKNLINIKIISSDHKRREYFLYVTRGNDTSLTSNNNTSANNTNVVKNENSQNVQAGGAWQYKKVDGTLATGWTLIGSEWYYFDLNGSMKTGWFKDTSGKWYYLKDSGAMAKNTVIDGYKIGSDGVYIVK